MICFWLMAKKRELVVVVDKEARETLSGLSFRYFHAARREKDRTYILRTPLGERRRVKGTLVRNPNLREHAAEYLYLEVNDSCNFACSYCGVGGDIRHTKLAQLVNEEARYITPEFVSSFAESIMVQPFTGLVRKFFYGGGEPLLNPKEYKRVTDGFGKVGRTIHIVSTNGCNLPLGYNEFASFVQGINSPYIFLTVSEEHKRQYASLRQEDSEELARYIPQNVQPEHALEEKVKIIGKHCEKLGIGFTVNVVEGIDSPTTEKDLRQHIIDSGIEVIVTELNGHRDPCSQGQEMAIRSNGDLYPHCYDIFTGKNKIGVVGLLVR